MIIERETKIRNYGEELATLLGVAPPLVRWTVGPKIVEVEVRDTLKSKWKEVPLAQQVAVRAWAETLEK